MRYTVLSFFAIFQTSNYFAFCHNILRLSDTRVAKFVLRHADKVHAQQPYKEFVILDEAACIDRCVTDGANDCKSINFYKNSTDVESSICQLINKDITDSNEYTDKTGWRHFDTGRSRITRLIINNQYCYVPSTTSQCDFTTATVELQSLTSTKCNSIGAYFDFDRSTGVITHVCSGKALCPDVTTFGSYVYLKDLSSCSFFALDVPITATGSSGTRERQKYRISMSKFCLS